MMQILFGRGLGRRESPWLRGRVDGALRAWSDQTSSLRCARGSGRCVFASNGSRGELAGLRLAQSPITVGAGEIEVEVRAAGLNFRDVLTRWEFIQATRALRWRMRGFVVAAAKMRTFCEGDES